MMNRYGNLMEGGRRLPCPGKRIDIIAVYVKEKVEKATGRRQRPQFDNLSMDDGEFVFQIR